MLSACLVPNYAVAQTFQITSDVQKQWEEYLSKIGTAKNGAFAVSVDGYGSHYVWCDSSAPCGAVNDALRKCRKNSGMDCKLMAKAREPEFAFEVAKLTEDLPDDSPIKARILDEEAIKAKIVGNTMSGLYINNLKWAEFFDPDGTIHGRDDMHGAYTATYEIADNKLCTDYPGEVSDNCIYVSMDGDRVDTINKDGNLNISLFDTVMSPRNTIPTE